MFHRLARYIPWLGAAGAPATNGVVRNVRGAPGGAASKALSADRRPEAKSIGKLVKEVEEDYQFSLGVLALKALIQGAKVSIEVDGDARAQLLADNLQQTWQEMLPHCLKAIGYGRAAFERWYDYEPKSSLYTLGGLDYLTFEQTDMLLSEEGAFRGVKVRPKNSDPITLAPERCWWFALDPTPQEPHGRSRYLGAPLNVLIQRQKLGKNEAAFLAKFALGHGMAKAPSEYPKTTVGGKGTSGEMDDHGQPITPIVDVMRQLETLRSGGVLVLPSETDESGKPLFEYTPPASQAASAEPLENYRRALDAAALRSLGIPERALTQDGATGSYAMAEAHRKVLAHTVEEILTQVVASYQQYVIDKAVELNWSAGRRPVLTMVWQPISDERRDVMIELVKTLVQAPAVSPLVAAGVIDVVKILEIADMPAGESAAERLRQIAGAPAPLAAGGAGVLPSAGGAVPVVEDVQATALNGAQIESMVTVVQQVAAGTLPYGSAQPLLEAAFPMLPPTVISRIITPVLGFTPAASAPVSIPPPPSATASLSIRTPEEVEGWETYFGRAQEEAEEIYTQIAREMGDRTLNRRSLRRPHGEARAGPLECDPGVATGGADPAAAEA